MIAPILLGIVHAIVDASTVSAVMRATHLAEVSPRLAFAMVVGYDIIAFGSQVLLGWLTDRFLNPRIAVVSGLLLTAFGLISSPLDPTTTVALAGIGNALFHLGGGALVLRSSLTRAAPQGVFVAPGALGLGFGLFYGSVSTRGPLWPLLALILTALVAFLIVSRLGKASKRELKSLVARFYRNDWSFGPAAPRRITLLARFFGHSPKPQFAPRIAGTPHLNRFGVLARITPSVTRHAYWIVALLLASVTVRSLVGLSAARGYSRTELLIIGLPVAAFLGKSVGGFIADRLGWLETSVAALLFSVPFISMSPSTPWLLFGLFVFQMTMPVTLTAVAQLMPNHPATALGWTCLALILGALPTMFRFGDPLCARSLLGAWIILGTACLALGLHLLGVKSLLRLEVRPNVAQRSS